MYKRNVFGFELKAQTERQLNEMYDLLNYEDYDKKRFSHYFHVWVHEGTGVYWFPIEKYYGGTTPYAVALLHRALLFDRNSRNNIHESDYAYYEEYSN